MVFGGLGRDAGTVLSRTGRKFWRCDCRCQEDRKAAASFILIRVRADAN